MRNIKGIIKQLIVLAIMISLCAGCQGFKAIRAIQDVDVNPQYCTFQDKQVILVPLVHYGKEEFYGNLKDSITTWKNENYKICYELIRTNINAMNIDSITYVKLLLKWRKINGGFTDNNKRYAQMNEIFNDCIPQPKYKELGIDSLDINTDVTLVEWVNEFENYYGNIELDSCDYTTHFDSVYTCGEKFDVDFRPIMVDYRNEQVVKKIKDLESNKLVILFGAAHISGLRNLLKKHTADRSYM